MNLFQDQEQAIEMIKNNRVSILTGCPGTGKTTTIKMVIDYFKQQGLRISLAAPTGKAAQRMTEATGERASTIHRLLGVEHLGNSLVFSYHADNPLETDMVIIDETSMVNVPLMASLLDAIEDSTRLLLVGDIYQLAAIGAGNVLKDLINSKVIKYFELNQIKRQDPGLIITNCHRIKNGEMIEIDNKNSKDFYFIEENDEQNIQSIIIDLVSKRLPEKYLVDPVKDIQVLSPLNEKTELSCKSLNTLLENTLNKEEPIENYKFRINSKVIQTKNDYGHDIVNGDVGFVKDISDGTITVEFENPSRIVDLPMYENYLQLAYALTVHKFQGSEMNVVVMPVHRGFGPMIMQRNLLYTGISRGRKIVVLVGQKDEVWKVIQRNQCQRRFTNLSTFLN